jgi:hypothetical protein
VQFSYVSYQVVTNMTRILLLYKSALYNVQCLMLVIVLYIL